MEIVETICSFSAIIVALISLIEVWRKNKSNERIKMIEVQEGRKMDALEEFLKNADLYTSSHMSDKMFLGCFSPVMMYLNEEQRETVLKAKRCVQMNDKKGAEQEIEKLSAQIHDQIFPAKMKRTSKGTNTKIKKR